MLDQIRRFLEEQGCKEFSATISYTTPNGLYGSVTLADDSGKIEEVVDNEDFTHDDLAGLEASWLAGKK
jgi:hypothetical protein